MDCDSIEVRVDRNERDIDKVNIKVDVLEDKVIKTDRRVDHFKWYLITLILVTAGAGVSEGNLLLGFLKGLAGL